MAHESSLGELLDRVERRAAGDPSALDGSWAERSTSWRSYNASESSMSAAERERLSRAELEAFRRAMPDFRRTSMCHLSPSTNTIVEQSTWAGTATSGPVKVELCLVYHVEDGSIARVEMYGDAAQFEQLGAAIHSA
jgi:ketosteroid isomerase-like protein